MERGAGAPRIIAAEKRATNGARLGIVTQPQQQRRTVVRLHPGFKLAGLDLANFDHG